MQPSSVGACAFLAPHSASCSNCRTQGTHWWWWHCSREASGVGVAIPPRWIVELAVRAAGCCNMWSLNFRLVSTPSHLLWCLTESTWFSSVNNHPVYLSTRKAKTMFLSFLLFRRWHKTFECDLPTVCHFAMRILVMQFVFFRRLVCYGTKEDTRWERPCGTPLRVDSTGWDFTTSFLFLSDT